MKKITQHALLILITMTMVACADKNIKSPTPIPPPAPPLAKCDCVIEKPPVQIADTEKPVETKLPDTAKELAKLADYSLLKPAQWEEIDGLQTDNLSLVWPAWMQSCSTLVNKPTWQKACNAAVQLNNQTTSKPSKNAVQAYLKQYFSVYKTTNVDGSDNGLITGYYQPLLKGSRTQSAQYPYPLYASPSDLITVELDTLFPELKFKRVRGRLVGNKLVPYYNRAEIETEDSPVKGQEFIYIDDIIDVFFLQIQGSGLVQLENGEQVHVGYANQNGHT